MPAFAPIAASAVAVRHFLRVLCDNGASSDYEAIAVSDCCPRPEQSPVKPAACCEPQKRRVDFLLWVPLAIVVVLYVLHRALPTTYWVIERLGGAIYELINTMALGMVIGVIMVAVISYVPRELVIGALGTGKGFKGLFRATAAGVLLDLCSHGILMVGAKLYERGVSTGQVMAFLIASPWNSISLTVILIALIGLEWTLAFIVLSVIIALLSGHLFDWLVAQRVLPANPNAMELPQNFRFWPGLKAHLRGIRLTRASIGAFVLTGLRESRMVIRWLLIGVLLAALIRTFVAQALFGTYFGPTLLGLAVTMLAATVVEVCSEGATPVAADIFNRAAAPGNGFAFLMAGVSTDYTEIMVLKERTRSWRLALFLPVITLPQIAGIALVLNLYFS